MTAIVLHDLAGRRESRAWYFTAARAVAESGDGQLHAWVLARKAMVPLNHGGATTIGTATTLRADGFETTKQLG
ncbi:hypothetical protein [Streptomyces sp. NPDC088254]|uniref:hypothetical protein n=1 Tax=Streptomyces sp. NPDC088254 TaxID=3365847 RepID=UPI003829FF15